MKHLPSIDPPLASLLVRRGPSSLGRARDLARAGSTPEPQIAGAQAPFSRSLHHSLQGGTTMSDALRPQTAAQSLDHYLFMQCGAYILL